MERRVLVQNAIKVRQDELVIVEIEINQVYPLITSPIVIIQMGDGATLLYVLDIHKDNSHYQYFNKETISYQEIQKKNTQGFNSKKPPIYSFDSVPCKSTKDCMTSVQESRKWFRQGKNIRLIIDFDYKLLIRPTFVQFGSLISRSGLRSALIGVQLRYLQHTFKHLGTKLNSEMITFQIIIDKHQIIPYWMLSDHPYDKQQNQNKKKRHQYYDQYKTGSFAFFQPDYRSIKIPVNKRDSKQDFFVFLGQLFFFPAEKGVYRGTLSITLLFKPLNYSYEYFIQYEARVFGHQALQFEVFYQKDSSQNLHFALFKRKQELQAVDPLKQQCKQYRQALNLTEMALNLPVTDLDQDGNVIKQPKSVLGRRTRQSDEQIVKVQEIFVYDLMSQDGVSFKTEQTNDENFLKKFNLSNSIPPGSMIYANTSVGLISFSPEVRRRNLLCFTPQTISKFRSKGSRQEKSQFYCPSEQSQKNKNITYRINQDGVFYVANQTQFPYRIIFKLPSVVFRLIFVENVALTHGEIYQTKHCFQQGGNSNCAWIFPRSVMKIRVLLINNLKSDPASQISEINYSLNLILDDIYTQGIWKWKSQGYRLSAPSIRKDKNFYLLKFRHQIKEDYIEISPPQLHLQDIYMQNPVQRLVTVTTRYLHHLNSIHSVKAQDSRIIVQNIDIVQNKVDDMNEMKITIKITVDLRKSLLPPSFARIDRQFVENIQKSPTLHQIFNWKRKQLQWKYLQENGLDNFEGHVRLLFNNVSCYMRSLIKFLIVVIKIYTYPWQDSQNIHCIKQRQPALRLKINLRRIR